MLSVLLACLACKPRVVVEDYSDFERFGFEQESGLGFCPDLDAVFGATLERTADGQLVFAAARLLPDSRVDEDCPTGIRNEAGCTDAEPGEPRLLSADERAKVRKVFATVRVHPKPDPKCKRMGIDPCRILRFEWDAREHHDFVCSENRLPSEQARAIVDLLDSLSAGS